MNREHTNEEPNGNHKERTGLYSGALYGTHRERSCNGRAGE